MHNNYYQPNQRIIAIVLCHCYYNMQSNRYTHTRQTRDPNATWSRFICLIATKNGCEFALLEMAYRMVSTVEAGYELPLPTVAITVSALCICRQMLRLHVYFCRRLASIWDTYAYRASISDLQIHGRPIEDGSFGAASVWISGSALENCQWIAETTHGKWINQLTFWS